VEGNSKDDYATTLRSHVIPFIGASRIAEMNRTAARNYVTALLDGGRSANTIGKCKVVLGRCSVWRSWTTADRCLQVGLVEGHSESRPFAAPTVGLVRSRRDSG
jgi:hypothetical protein